MARANAARIRRLFLLLFVMIFVVLFSAVWAEEEGAINEQFQQAYNQYHSGAVAQAEQNFRRFVESYPESRWTPTAYFILGKIQFQNLNKGEAALRDFRMVVDRFPESSLADDAYYYIGFIYQFVLRDREQALAAYRRGYYRYPEGDFVHSLADKIREITGSLPPRVPPAETEAPSMIPRVVQTPTGETISISVPVAADADTEAPEPEVTVSLDFQDANIRSFIKVVSELTGKNFVIDDNVQGAITVVSPSQIPLSQVYDVFLSILEIKGYAAVPAGNVIKIVPRQEAAQGNIPMFTRGDEQTVYSGDEVVTRIIRIYYADAGEVQGVVRPLLSGLDSLVVHPRTNSLVITGPVSSIERIEGIIRELDQEGSQLRVEVYRLQNASAGPVVQAINEVVQGFVMPPGQTNRTKIIADARANVVVALADESFHRIIKDLVARLDLDEAAGRLTKAFALEHADAVDVKSQIDQILSGQNQDPNRVTRIVADARLNVIYVSTMSPNILSLVEQYIAEADRMRGATRASLHVYALQNTQSKKLAETLSTLYAASTREGGSGFAAEGIAIVSDEQSNSLLITATPEDYAVIESVIASLDVRRPQVLVEGFIAEVTLDTIERLGVELNTLDRPVAGSTRVLGGTNYGLRGSLLSGQATGMVLGVFKGSQIGPVIQILEQSSGVNVLSRPSILAMDNTEASIIVGDLVPVATSYSDLNYEAQGTTVPAVQIEYKNVGVELTITPHINQDSYVTLDIVQDVKTIRSTPIPNSSLNLPAFTQRTATTRVTVQDGDVIAIGGLISTNETENISKIPLLGDIPFFGLLFRNQNNEVVKTNLLIFITPRILTDFEDARQVTQERQAQYEEAVNETHPTEDPNSLGNVLH